jgi:hypothetical protein
MATPYHGNPATFVEFQVGDIGTSDLEPSTYHLFPVLKEHLGGYRFQSDDDMETAVNDGRVKRTVTSPDRQQKNLSHVKYLSFCGDYVRK